MKLTFACDINKAKAWTPDTKATQLRSKSGQGHTSVRLNQLAKRQSKTFDSYNYCIGPVDFFYFAAFASVQKTTHEPKSKVWGWPWPYDKAKEYLQGPGPKAFKARSRTDIPGVCLSLIVDAEALCLHATVHTWCKISDFVRGINDHYCK